MDPSPLLAFALDAAHAAGAELLRCYGVGGCAPIGTKEGQSRNLLTAADGASERLILERLRAAFPDDAVLAEESAGECGFPDAAGFGLRGQGAEGGVGGWGLGAREGIRTSNLEPQTSNLLPPGGRLWVIDPLDGTVNFSHGMPAFCVSIAVLDEHGPLAGVVHAPYLRETFFGARGGGAWLGRVSGDGAATSRKRERRPLDEEREAGLGKESEPQASSLKPQAFERPPARLRVSTRAALPESMVCTGFSYNRDTAARKNFTNFTALAKRARAIRRMGAAALDLCYVAAGRLDGYWEFWLHPWDVAAGALFVQEAGGRVTDFAGGPHWLFAPEIIATNGRIHDALRAELRDE